MVTIRTVSGTPEGDIIRTMKVTPDEKYETLQKVVKEKARKIKTLGELKEGFMYDVGEKAKKTRVKKRRKVIRKAGSVIERMYKKGRSQHKAEIRQIALMRKQLAQQQAIEANRIAQEQRSMYESPAESFGYGQQQMPMEEQYIEEDYIRQPRPSALQSFFRKIIPNSGVMERLGNLSGIPKKGEQVRTRKGGRNIIQQQPTILNTPRITLFQSQLNKPKNNLKW